MVDIILKHNAGFMGTQGKLLRSRTVIDPCSFSVGDIYGGGIIAYKFVSGDPGFVSGECHGLIVSPTDQSTGLQWYNGSFITTGAIYEDMGYGYINTLFIQANQGYGTYAAKLCLDLNLNNYSDWFLPSKYELFKCTALYGIGLGSFSTNNYWASTESDNANAWAVNISTGSAFGLYDKDHAYSVRAMRYY